MHKEMTEVASKAERKVRCTRTQMFWKGDGWTGDKREAQAFRDEMEVAEACVVHGLRDIEMVLCDGEVELFVTRIR